MTYTVYSKEGCNGCESVKLLLSDLNIDYIDLELYEDFSSDQFRNLFGDLFPGILKDNKVLGGYIQLIEDLKKDGIIDYEESEPVEYAVVDPKIDPGLTK